uniref:SFRICE_020520 n=1 Tax=Spodoptera frugiperda TaxID=7108 RepID=A0A2H1VYV0_SPOFR
MVQPTRATAADWCEAGGKVRRAARRRTTPSPAPRRPELLQNVDVPPTRTKHFASSFLVITYHQGQSRKIQCTLTLLSKQHSQTRKSKNTISHHLFAFVAAMIFSITFYKVSLDISVLKICEEVIINVERAMPDQKPTHTGLPV